MMRIYQANPVTVRNSTLPLFQGTKFRTVCNATKELTEGRLDIQVEKLYSDEIGEMTDSFNLAIRILKQYVQELTRVLTRLSEGDFTVTAENEANLDNPILYNNLANPITLSYSNQNIKSDFTITDTSTPITYDGSLLKRCNVDLASISCKLSFDIYLHLLLLSCNHTLRV